MKTCFFSPIGAVSSGEKSNFAGMTQNYAEITSPVQRPRHSPAALRREKRRENRGQGDRIEAFRAVVPQNRRLSAKKIRSRREIVKMTRRSGAASRAERSDPSESAQDNHPAGRHRDGVLDDRPEKYIFPLNAGLQPSGKEEKEEIAPKRKTSVPDVRADHLPRAQGGRRTAGIPDFPPA